MSLVNGHFSRDTKGCKGASHGALWGGGRKHSRIQCPGPGEPALGPGEPALGRGEESRAAAEQRRGGRRVQDPLGLVSRHTNLK